jgi:hypothetical protein
VRVTEYVSECRRNTEIWKTMPRRMIRHRSLVQCARVAFGLSGIWDEEEAEEVMRTGAPPPPAPQPSNAERFQAMASADVTDVEPTPSEPETSPDHGTEPPAPTLEAFLAQVERAGDVFESEMIIEEARDLLNDEEVRELCAAHVRRFEGDEQ